MAPSLSSPSVVLAVPVILGSLIYLKNRSAKKPLPPGPPGLPLIGNAFDLPTRFLWDTFAEWSDRYDSPIVSVSVMGINIVVLDTVELASEVFDHRGSNYSGRHHSVMLADLLGWAKTTILLDYGPRLRSVRKLYHEEIGTPRLMQKFGPISEENAKTFVQRCAQFGGGSAQTLRDLCFKHASRNILQITYGTIDDDTVRLGMEAMDIFVEGASFLVNQLPMLRYVPEWFPGGRFQTVAREGKPVIDRLVEEPFRNAKQEISSGAATKESLLSKWLAKAESPDEEDLIKHAAASLFGAGLETTAMTTQVFFLLMAAFPDVQKKLQNEMDAVVGAPSTGVSPSFQDRENLPYLEAVLKEVFRFHPGAPASIPRNVAQDDIVGGYLIPKDSIVFMNIWRMTRNTKTYAQPDEFKPERFLGPKPERDPKDLIFGIGRRFCSGKHIANDSLFITFAMIIATLDIKPVAQDDSASLLKKLKGQGHLINHPLPFELSITPRSKA